MNEIELRREAVRRRQAGETTRAMATSLGRTSRWVRKWVARHETAEAGQDWAQSRSWTPKCSPRRTPNRLRQQVLDARAKLEANPMSQYGALAIASELQLLGSSRYPRCGPSTGS